LVLAFETVPFGVLVEKVRRVNEGNKITLEMEGGCWWEAVVRLLKSNNVRVAATKRMADDTGKIFKQRRKKWKDEHGEGEGEGEDGDSAVAK